MTIWSWLDSYFWKRKSPIEIDDTVGSFEEEKEKLKKVAEYTNFCKPEDVENLVRLYRQFPDFCTILRRILIWKKFFAASDFYCWIAYVTETNVNSVYDFLILTQWISDASQIIKYWATFRDGNWAKNIYASEAYKRIDSVYKVIKDFYKQWEYFSMQFKFLSFEIILKYSKESRNDVFFVSKISWTYHKIPNEKELEIYYQQWHKYICHDSFWGKWFLEPKTPINPDEIALASKIAQLDEYPPLWEQKKIISKIFWYDIEIAQQLSKLYYAFCEQKIPSSAFILLLDTLSEEKEFLSQNTSDFVQVLQKICTYNTQNISIALHILVELISNAKEHFWFFKNYFITQRLEEIEQVLFKKMMEEHLKKFPEKPLDEVERSFERQTDIDAEVPSTEQIKRAFSLYREVLEKWKKLIETPKSKLLENLLELEKHKSISHEDWKISFFANLRELFKRTFWVYPYNTQMIAIFMLLDEENLKSEETQEKVYKWVYEQIKTGEGKSLIFWIISAYLAFCWRKVDIITSNSYLAKRDMLKFSKFFWNLWLTTDVHIHGKEEVKWVPDILYTTNHDMVFSYLSSWLSWQSFMSNARFDVALVDEADNLCIDMGQDSCRIAQPALWIFNELHLKKFLDFADQNEYLITSKLPEAIKKFIEFLPEVSHIHPIYIWLYLKSALYSHNQVENEDFIIRDKKIIVVDVHNTGRIKENTQWGHWLHEFVALRNNLPIPEHTWVSAQMNHPTFIKKYKNLFCISWTFWDQIDRNEIQELYRLQWFDIPPHNTSHRLDLPLTLEINKSSFQNWVLDKIKTENEKWRPILLITSSIWESLEFKNILEKSWYSVQLLNDSTNIDIHWQEQTEEHLIKLAGTSWIITIATSIAGRWADIIPDSKSIEAGWLYSLLTFIPFNKRVEFQWRGRSGRQWNPWSSEIYACLESDLFFQTIPTEAQLSIVQLIQIFWPNSKEVQAIIEIIRKSKNLIQSIHRKLNIEKEEIVENALEKYLDILKDTSSNLRINNPIIRSQLHSEALASFLIREYVSDTWTQWYDYLSNVISHGSILWDWPNDDIDLSKEIDRKLSICFENSLLSFGLIVGWRLWENIIWLEFASIENNKKIYFVQVLESLRKFYRKQIVKTQQLAASLDTSKIWQIVKWLESEVQAKAKEAKDRFTWANVVEIQDFIKERTKKEKQ